MTAVSRPYVWKSSDYDEADLVGGDMEFRLVYEGQLKASTNDSRRVQEKHAIRRVLHKQLAALWNQPPLAVFKTDPPLRIQHPREPKITTPTLEIIANQFTRCGYRFVPLVGNHLSLMCSLDMLFLRRENPGGVLHGGGGDIDNRLKTLLDALRIPETCDEVKGSPPDESENPFFCLLENDNRITAIKIDTDRLLRPLQGNEHENDVLLVIRVKITGTDVTLDNLPLLT